MKRASRAALLVSALAGAVLAAWEALVDVPVGCGWAFDWRGPASCSNWAIAIEMFLTVGVVLGYGAFLAVLLDD